MILKLSAEQAEFTQKIVKALYNANNLAYLNIKYNYYVWGHDDLYKKLYFSHDYSVQRYLLHQRQSFKS